MYPMLMFEPISLRMRQETRRKLKFRWDTNKLVSSFYKILNPDRVNDRDIIKPSRFQIWP